MEGSSYATLLVSGPHSEFDYFEGRVWIARLWVHACAAGVGVAVGEADEIGPVECGDRGEVAAAEGAPHAVVNKLLSDFPMSMSMHVHLADDEAGPARTYITGAAFGLAYTVAHPEVDRLGVCCAAPCRFVFVDTSTNAARHYCSDRCATRANVAAYRARRKAASDACA